MPSTLIKFLVNRRTERKQTFRIPGCCELCLQPAGSAGFLCDACLQALPYSTCACSQCAEPLTSPGRCGRCQSSPPAYDYGFSTFLYQPPLSLWVQAAKDHEQLVWLNRLAWLMSRSPPSTLAAADALIYIPSSRRRMLQRGYNPGEILARRTAGHLGLPLYSDALVRTGGRDQRGLTATERRRNLKQSLTHGQRRFCGEHLLIVDDVMTTGATADAAARLLKRQGAGLVGIWSLCRTPASSDKH